VLAQNEIRLPELVPIRHGHMSASLWTYFRGAAAVMAADLASAPHTGLDVQLCGDAHVLNFGLWATPERALGFDVRDFDETLRGPFEWDVKRFATSIVVLARDNCLPATTGERAVAMALRAYREWVAAFATAKQLDIWYDLVTAGDLIGHFRPEDRERVSARVEKQARRRTSRGAFRKLTTTVDGQPRIVEDPPIRVRPDDPAQLQLVADVFDAYRASLRGDLRHLLDRFAFVDVVRQIVGVGSVGMRVYLVLLRGSGGDDPLFLQVKQAGPSVYEGHLGDCGFDNHGERVIAGKHLIQTAPEIFLGWTSMRGMDFYVRRFRDMKVVADSDRIAPHVVEFARACAAVLARAHARTGDAAAIDSYIGKGRAFDEAIGTFAHAYAHQNERDHRQLSDEIARGAVPSAPGW
jgi:uncharacterized protein (DUF2252 family)